MVCKLFYNSQVSRLTITYTKFYVPVVTLSTQDNAKLLEQLKSSFKRAINWNKYQSRTTVQEQNRYLDSLIDPSFHGTKWIFVFSFANKNGWACYASYHPPQVELKGYNVMMDGRNVIDQPVKNNLRPYHNIQKNTTCWLLDYSYFKNYCKMIAIDLSKQQAFDATPKAIQ